MKILYIASRINADDGSSVHCRAFVEHAVKLGHEVRTYPAVKSIIPKPRIPTVQQQKNIKYYLKKVNLKTLQSYLHRGNPYMSEFLSFLEGWLSSRKQSKIIVDLLRSFRADVIIYRHQPFNLAPFYSASNFNIPVVMEVNSLRTMEAQLSYRRSSVTVLSRWAERKAVLSANAIFTVSKAIKRKISEYTVSSNIKIIPNGVDTDFFDPKLYNRKEIRTELSLDDKIVIGYVGSYKNWHGLDLTVDTLECLLNRRSNYHLLLIGNGPCYSEIQTLINNKEIRGSVTQVETVPHMEIPKYMAAFDVALMSYPTYSEFYFSPLKMFEYMSMRVPVVSSDVGQIGEIIINEKNGILAFQSTPDGFADAIEHAYANRDRIGKSARELMASEFSWLENAKKALSISESVLNERMI